MFLTYLKQVNYKNCATRISGTLRHCAVITSDTLTLILRFFLFELVGKKILIKVLSDERTGDSVLGCLNRKKGILPRFFLKIELMKSALGCINKNMSV